MEHILDVVTSHVQVGAAELRAVSPDLRLYSPAVRFEHPRWARCWRPGEVLGRGEGGKFELKNRDGWIGQSTFFYLRLPCSLLSYLLPYYLLSDLVTSRRAPGCEWGEEIGGPSKFSAVRSNKKIQKTYVEHTPSLGILWFISQNKTTFAKFNYLCQKKEKIHVSFPHPGTSHTPHARTRAAKLCAPRSLSQFWPL